MKVSICDSCKDKDKPIYFKITNEELCEECYFESDHYTKDDIEEEWGMEIASKVKDVDGFIVLDYESIQYYNEDSKKIAKRLNEVFKKLDIPLTAIGKYTENNCIIGFKKL